MKKMKKFFALLIAVAMVLSMCISAFAQDKASGMGGDATITIDNAAKGETYKVVKLFDATITTPPSTAIAYTGTIPTALASFFEKDTEGNVTLKRIADSSGKNPGDEGYVDTFYTITADDFATIKTWADGIAATDTTYPNVSEVSDGSTLNFTGLKYGYYVVTSTQGALVTVDSTNKNVTIIDKNTKEPSATKTADKTSGSVGDTVTYTATFNAPNYLQNGDASEQVVSYIIEDTLPSFLSDVTVTEVKIVETPAQAAVEDDPATDTDESKPAVDEVATTLTAADYQFTDKKIEIPWVAEEVPTDTHKYTSLYKNGSQIVLTYTAKITSEAAIGAGNVNKVSLKPQVDRGDGKKPFTDQDKWNSEYTIYTHAAALQKKANSESGENLAGAEFKFKGLIVSGTPGFYTVVSYAPNAAEGTGTVMKCDANGKLVIAGIDANADTPIKLVGTETKAPDGFNKLEGTFELSTIVMATTTTTTHGEKTTYYDADGNIVDEEVTGGSSITRKEVTAIETIPAASIQNVVNKQGKELPSTGGIGTTIFYIVGAMLVIGAGVVLVTRRRMDA